MNTKNVVENYFNAMKEGRFADMQKYISPNKITGLAVMALGLLVDIIHLSQ